MRATPVKVKVCGLFRQADIWAINQAKPDYCGFVVNFPKSHRSLSPEAVRLLRAGLDAAVTPVGVFVDQPVELVAGLLNSDVVSVAQLHGSEDGTYLAALRSLTHGPIWQAFPVRSAADLERAAASAADFVLLDAGQGTGQSFDWSLLAGFPRPSGLAGGAAHGQPGEGPEDRCGAPGRIGRGGDREVQGCGENLGICEVCHGDVMGDVDCKHQLKNAN